MHSGQHGESLIKGYLQRVGVPETLWFQLSRSPLLPPLIRGPEGRRRGRPWRGQPTVAGLLHPMTFPVVCHKPGPSAACTPRPPTPRLCPMDQAGPQVLRRASKFSLGIPSVHSYNHKDGHHSNFGKRLKLDTNLMSCLGGRALGTLVHHPKENWQLLKEQAGSVCTEGSRRSTRMQAAGQHVW